MRKFVGVSVVFIAVFIVSVLTYLPASIVVSQLQLPAQLQLSGLRGTVWRGSVKQVRWQDYDFGELQWRIVPTALFSGNVEASVRFGRDSVLNLKGKGEVGYGMQGAYASNFVVSIPMDEVVKRAPIKVPIVTQGQLEATIRSYTYQAPYCLNAEGTLAWSQAKVESPLGSLSLDQTIADVSCDNSVLTVKGSQKSDQVSSLYSAQLNPERIYKADGWFKPEAAFPSQLSQHLKWLPKPDNQGRYQFNKQGRL